MADYKSIVIVYAEYNDLIAKVARLEKTVAKLEKQLKDAEDDNLFLEALESAGVDNWGGYDEARAIYNEMKNEE